MSKAASRPVALPPASRPFASSRLALALVGLAAARAALAATEDSEVVAISAHASDDYQRVTLPDGSLQPETYAFGEGGHWFSSMQDASLDQVNFKTIARTLAVPLAEQGYVPGHDPEKTNLLIMVYWGMTTGAGGATGTMAHQGLQATQPIATLKSSAPPPPGVSNGAFGLSQLGNGASAAQTGQLSAQVQGMILITMENNERDRANLRKAGILGYKGELEKTAGLEITPMRYRRERLIDELEDNRYFVVLLAYDFPLLWKEKKRKLVWEARYSIRERDNRFDHQLESMTRSAARFFGRNSDGLQRQSIPRGEVEMGDLKIIGVEPGK